MIRFFAFIRAFCVLATAGAGATIARAENPAPRADAPATVPGETIFVIDEGPDRGARDRERVLGDAPFVTVLHPDDHPATASVAEALATTAGVQMRSLGGFGAYQGISVRGAAHGHTAVLIDGVPLARIAAVTTDLGRFALDSFGELALYRGAVPVELGGAGIGGAVNMVTRLGRGERGERFHASIGAGSYGARHVRAHYGDDHDDIRAKSSTTIGYQGAAGDFTYFDDNGTLLNKNDDRFHTRTNNGFDQLDAATRIGATKQPAAAGVRLAFKRQGLPGSIASPTSSARLSTFDAIVDARGDAHVGSAIARQLGFLLFERQGLFDPDNEIGLGASERTYTTLSVGVSSTWKGPVRTHRLAGGLELRGDSFGDRDETGMRPGLDGARVGGALTGAIDLALASQLVVTPALRVDALHSAPTPMTVGPMALDPIARRWDVVPSPRVSVRANITDDLAIKGSTGWYTRLPTVIEVFGNRGFIIGSPDLRPERGPSSDVGAVWAPSKPKGPIDRILVQGDVFANRSHDTIAYITTVGYVARAVNIDDTQAYGAELIASARFAEMISATASYTRLVTTQLSSDPVLHGSPIPRRPGHLLYARLDATRSIAKRAMSLWFDTGWQGESTLDQAALARVPQRLLIGTGARVEIAAGFALSATVANLSDHRVAYLPLDPPPSPTLIETPTALTDVTGFPLPGRSFYLALNWTH